MEESLPQRTLHGAVSTEDVSLVQSALRSQGFDPGDVDGIHGPETAAAVSEFQTKNGLSMVDGVVGPETWRALQKATKGEVPDRPLGLILRGATGGDDVRRLQEALLEQGHDPGAVDAIYGPDTERAVVAYQSAQQLAVDGIAGPETWESLMTLGAASAIATDLVPRTGLLAMKLIDGLPIALVARGDGTVERIDVSTGRSVDPPLRSVGESAVEALAMASGADHVAAVVAAGAVEVWDVTTGAIVGDPIALGTPVSSLSATTVAGALFVAVNAATGPGIMLQWGDFRDRPADSSQNLGGVSLDEGLTDPVVFDTGGRGAFAAIERTETPHRLAFFDLPDRSRLGAAPTGADAGFERLIVGGEPSAPVVVSRSEPGLIERWEARTRSPLPGVIGSDGSDSRHFAAAEGFVVVAADSGPLRVFDILSAESIKEREAFDTSGQVIVDVAAVGNRDAGAVAVLDSAGTLRAIHWGEFEARSVDFRSEPWASRDYWTALDTLGYQPYAQAMVSFIQHDKTKPPLTLGVKGAWGSGKSSVMRMVQAMLDPPCDPDESKWRFPEVVLTAGARRKLDLKGGAGRTEGDDCSKTDAADDRRGLSIERMWRVIRKRDPQVPKFTESAVKPTAPPEDDAGKWRPTVWFNPWMYQTGEEVWAGFAQEIITQVTDRLPPMEQETFWLELNLRRVDRHAVRKKLYGMVIDRIFPALIVAALSISLLIVWLVSGATLAGIVSVLGLVGSLGSVLGGVVRFGKGSAFAAMPELVRGPVAAAGSDIKDDLGSFSDVIRDPEYEARAGFLYLLQNDIKHVLELIATEERPLVVFVDDLDRCSPGVVAQTIEAINLFLAGEFPNCIFVLAVEPAVVAAHVESQHKELVEYLKDSHLGGDWMALGWRFLEKIVQLPLTLPRPDRAKADLYLDSLFPGAEGDEGETPVEQAVTTAAAVAVEGFTASTFQEVSDERAKLARKLAEEAGYEREEAESIATAVAVDAAAELWDDDDPTVRRIIKQHALALPARNPREMKRFINLFRFYNYVAAPQWVQGAFPVVREEVFEQVARIATLSIRWPFFLDLLGRPVRKDFASDPGPADRLPTMLEELEDAARSGTWLEALERLDLAAPAKESGDDEEPGPPVPVEAWAKQLKELHVFLTDAEAPRIGSFARGFL